MKTKFYLTEGFINQMRDKISFFRKTSQTETSTGNVVYRLVNPRPILKALEIVVFDPKDEYSLLNRYGILLSDGREEVTVTIDESLKDLFNRNESGRFLQEGSVIMVNEIKILSIRDLLNKEELDKETDKDKKIICLLDITLLGISILSDIEKETKKDIHKEASHSISELNLFLTKSAWCIKAKLISKSLIREFENRTNGTKGIFQRFLFLDNSGQIEAVCFNDLCKDKNIECLSVNKTYLIENGELKKARSNLKAWPNSLTVDYDIMFTNMTTISECDEIELIFHEDNLSDIKLNGNENSLLKTYTKNDKFTNLSKLLTMKAESIVDVLGIITEVGPLKKLANKSNLSIRNVKIIDRSNFEINVAFWGKQAENFDKKAGSCLQLNKASLSNFNGISLSVMRFTEFFEQKMEYDIDIVTELLSWYEDRKKVSPNKRKRKELE
ncbi:unnamed protein product [Brachionus calyciflorus]|uniref:Replication protein A OB domain-containing protein n=1 Tax=Brachionus calyciflorus TaxID=104777 RepID=A0A814QEI9_9BILA|nr:unnamed protein product [Brachionus calyciflorus]